MYTLNPMFTQAPRPALRGMGQTSGSTDVQVDTTDVLNLGDQLRSAQARLTTLLSQMQQDADLARAIGASVTAQQAALSDLTAKYVGVYTAIFGQRPVGLGNPILIAAAVAVILGYVIAQLALWFKKQDTLEQQAQAQILAEQNRGALITQAQQTQQAAWDAQNSGDTATAQNLQSQANALFAQSGTPGGSPPPPPQPQDFASWIKANWLVVAGVGVGIVVLPRVLER